LLFLVAAHRAEATCGDYLQVPGEHSPADHGAKPNDDPAPDRIPCGCRGEACHGAPLSPPPQSPPRSHWQQDGNLLDLADRSLSLQRTWTRHSSAARPNRGYPLLLNRPPDALA
jgi:hypothetical protein